eukprot:TRINITY_DN22963_c0_g1_i1.p1 TRINITY_DN22963_c0_g1~~TRINITY_DN22963_c0_g1_i1.p1  ORF type:complete len:655 (+),score=73.06 TRINITY_DN22963_c0_g1_i1:140-1966(+)
MCIFNLWGVLVSAAVAGNSWGTDYKMLWAANVGFFVLFGTSLIWLLVRKTMPVMLVEVIMFIFALGLMMVDMDHMANGTQTVMPYFVLIVDMYILFRIKGRSLKLLIALFILWQIAICTERATRYGLLDSHSFTTSYETRIKDASCPEPPCAISWATSILESSSFVLIFLLDYWFTRGFSDKAEEEAAKMAAVIRLTRTMSASLAAFDLDSAEQSLDESGELLPIELYSSFDTLLHNLRSYKPYLPKSCFQFSDSEEEPKSATINSKSGSFSQSTIMTRLPTDATAMLGISRRPTCVTIRTDNPPPTPAYVPLRKNVVSLLLIDLHFDTKSILAQIALPSGCVRLSTYQRTHQHMITYLSVFDIHKGMVEHVTGDKVTVSFNASRGCSPPGPSSATAALRYHSALSLNRAPDPGSSATLQPMTPGSLDHTITDFHSGEIFMSIATGPALCGILGSFETRKFCITGPLPQYLHILNKYSKSLGYELTCNMATACDVSFLCECVLTLHTIECNLHPSHYIYRILTTSPSNIDRTRPPDEWMYELDALGYSKKWEDYNTAVQTFLRNGDSVAALNTLNQSESSDYLIEETRDFFESTEPAPKRLVVDDMWQ